MREEHVVRLVVSQYEQAGRFFINNHGTVMSRSGVPDIVTVDGHGRFLAVEVKRPGQKPTVNQLRRAAEVLRSGGRYVVAYADFDLGAVDRGAVRVWPVGGVEELGVEFEWFESFPAGGVTVELTRRHGDTVQR